LLLPATEKLVEKVLILPTGMAVGEYEFKEICRILKLALGNADEVRRRLFETRSKPELA
jgi:hypothetical protein